MRLLFFTLFIGNFLSAQNLVVNPGFEEHDPTSPPVYAAAAFGKGLPSSWYAPTDGTPDVLYFSDNYLDGLADKSHGLLPFEGNYYVRFFNGASTNEYIQGTLSEALGKEKLYTISVTISEYDTASFVEHDLGIYFSNKENPRYKLHGYCLLPWTPQIYFDQAISKSKTGKWTTYNFKYAASGGEASIVIGHFGQRDEITGWGFVFADSVSVSEYEEDEIEEVPIDTIAAAPEIPAEEIQDEEIEGMKIEAGKTLVVNNIYFENGQSRILPESYQPLYDIILEMKLQPNLNVEIVGHTDKHGDPKANQKLSEQRAQAVKDFFISKGIDASRITIRGAGSSEPVGDDDQKNRRVEFIFSE